jgi:serine/threonine protein kinase
VLAPGHEALAEKFLIEARAAAKVDSPYVARVMDVGTLESGAPFIVMERLEGCNLDELLFLEQRPAIADAVDYVLQALQGLAHAHVLGVVHRDLKPANLFLAKQADGTSTVKILDFGIAFILDEEHQKAPPTAKNAIVGSPMYMSPEQVRNDGAIDHRTDIWSIGVVLHELVTGKVPFGASASGMGELFGSILNDPYVPPSKVREDAPKDLDAVLTKALARNPDERYANVAELARALVPFGSGKWAHLADSIEQSFETKKKLLSGPDAFAPPEPVRRSWLAPFILFVIVGAAVWLAHRAHFF